MSDDVRRERIRKLELIRSKGLDPYPVESFRNYTIDEVLHSFDTLSLNVTKITLAGRIMSLRSHGGSVFFDIFDGTGRIQVYMKEDGVGIESFKLFNDVIDTSDFVEVKGKAFLTKKGQQSLLIEQWIMLAKSIHPIPDEWYGLKDEDERYRKRYIDILLNKEVAEIVRKKSLFWNTIRNFLLKRDFIEVETPVLENTTGGAEATPFITHHNALDINVFLRISAGELWQKKLMVAGVPKTFEIGRIFRNEGMSSEHLQDYTQLEFYEAFSDHKKGMEFVKELYKEVAQKVFGTKKFTIHGHSIDFDAEWKIYDFSKLIEERFGLNPITEAHNKTGNKVTQSELEEICKKADIVYEHAEYNIARIIDSLWKMLRKEISGPGFLIGVPVTMEPLAKRSQADKRMVERFQVIIAGSEVGKGYSELNDPLDQAERFKEQQKLRDAGDKEAQMADMEFVTALEYGMPPTFGFGVSERLFSFLMDKSVRETQLFPLMKPKTQ